VDAALGRIPDRDRRLLLLTASPSVTYTEISAARFTGEPSRAKKL